MKDEIVSGAPRPPRRRSKAGLNGLVRRLPRPRARVNHMKDPNARKECAKTYEHTKRIHVGSKTRKSTEKVLRNIYVGYKKRYFLKDNELKDHGECDNHNYEHRKPSMLVEKHAKKSEIMCIL